MADRLYLAGKPPKSPRVQLTIRVPNCKVVIGLKPEASAVTYPEVLPACCCNQVVEMRTTDKLTILRSDDAGSS